MALVEEEEGWQKEERRPKNHTFTLVTHYYPLLGVWLLQHRGHGGQLWSQREDQNNKGRVEREKLHGLLRILRPTRLNFPKKKKIISNKAVLLALSMQTMVYSNQMGLTKTIKLKVI